MNKRYILLTIREVIFTWCWRNKIWLANLTYPVTLMDGFISFNGKSVYATNSTMAERNDNKYVNGKDNIY